MENNLTYDIEYNPSKYPMYMDWGKDIFASDEIIYDLSEHIKDAIKRGRRIRLVVKNDVDQGFAIKMQTGLAEVNITVEVFRVPERGIGEMKEGRGGKRRRTRKTRRRKTTSRKRRGRKHKKTRTRARK